MENPGVSAKDKVQRASKSRMTTYKLTALFITFASLLFINQAKNKWGVEPPPDILTGYVLFCFTPVLLGVFLPDKLKLRTERWARRYLAMLLAVLTGCIGFVPLAHVYLYGIEHTACLFNSNEWSSLHPKLRGRVVEIKDRLMLVRSEQPAWYEPRMVDTRAECPMLTFPIVLGYPPKIGETVSFPLERCINPFRISSTAP